MEGFTERKERTHCNIRWHWRTSKKTLWSRKSIFKTQLSQVMREQTKIMRCNYSDDIPRKIEKVASKAPALGSKGLLDASTESNKNTRT